MHKRITTSTLIPNSPTKSRWGGHKTAVSIDNHPQVIAVFGYLHRRNLVTTDSAYAWEA